MGKLHEAPNQGNCRYVMLQPPGGTHAGRVELTWYGVGTVISIITASLGYEPG